MPGNVPMTYETNPMFRKAMDSMGSEVRSVRSDVDFLTDRLMDLGMSVDGLMAISPEPGDGGGIDNDIPQSASSSVDGDERAFEVFGVEFDDSGNQVIPISEWTVYVPSGCVQIDGIAVKFDNEVSDDRVSISPDVKGGVTLYCVVWKDKDGKAHAKICEGDDKRDALVASIGGNGGTLYASVPFCTLSDTYEDNNQIHLGVIALTSGVTKVDEVSADFMQKKDGDGNPVTESKEVDGVQKDVPVKTDVIEIKGWHEDDPVDGATLVGLMGLPVKTGVVTKDVIVRDGTKGGELKYYSLGEVDKDALSGDPCRVVSIGDGSVSESELSGKDLRVVEGAYVEVEYVKAGDCPGEGEEGHDDCRFRIPVVVSSADSPVDFSMDVSDEDVTGTQDHPNGGVKVTLSPSAGQGTNFTVWNGKDGENGNDGSPGAPGKDGNDAVVNVTQTANGATDVHKNGGTKVTLTPNNGGAAATFDVWNGNDGSPGAPGRTGDDGRSVYSVNAGEPVSQDGFTKTPVTFFDNAGNAIGTVDVAAKDGGAGQDQPFTIDMSLVVRYDLSTRQIQARDVTVRNGVVSYGNAWKMITGGQAAAHNSDFN